MLLPHMTVILLYVLCNMCMGWWPDYTIKFEFEYLLMKPKVPKSCFVQCIVVQVDVIQVSK